MKLWAFLISLTHEERQKVVRKITQVTRALAADDTPKSERKALKKTLKDLRVDLNYILVSPSFFV